MPALPDSPPPLIPLDLGRQERFGRNVFFACYCARLLLYVVFFHWAATSPTGDAALRGVVFGDLVTFLMFGTARLESTAGCASPRT